MDGEKEELMQVVEDVDAFLLIIGANGGKDVPDCVRVLPKLFEDMLDSYNCGRTKFGEDATYDNSFLDVVNRMYKLSTSCSCSNTLDQTSSVLEKAMSLLEKDLCSLLEEPKTPNKSFSFGSRSDLSVIFEIDSPEPPQHEQDHYHQDFLTHLSTHKISILNKIATTMIVVGYETECCIAFANFRRSAFKTALQRLGYRSMRMEDVCKMSWETLEREITTWNQVVRHCTTMLFNAERRLYDSIFPNQPFISQSLFIDLARHVIIHLLNFAQGVVLTKWSTEKLFKFLDMYETLREDIIGDSCLEPGASEVAYEIVIAKDRVIKAIVAMFCDLKNSIKNDNERIPVPNGAVHPLTRYVMNYLKYACEYKDTLEQVFEQGQSVNFTRIDIYNDKSIEEVEDVGTPKDSPFAIQLMSIMDLLDANVERKSNLYRDLALRYIFLMNNGRYIVQKVKGCSELHDMMGDNWCRKRQSGLRLYHKCYQRETWSKVLQCLKPEGLLGTGNKVSKQLVKERFKCFNSMFEEIHKTQSTWMVVDEQLQSELRVSISSLVIPAYRSFVGRFKQHLESSRHIDKYIKYHPEDIELLVDDFFDGNVVSMTRKRT
uniref:Exocyst subunit Exo70 family protein n=2 Tax=Cajanus cajan TaxID=3821 RepID=A0A151U8E4_CAJCA|nr:Exocyst complex component 7 [Cajanus cajan]